MVPDLVAHDAVGNDALGMYLSLLRKGRDVFLFTFSGMAKTPIDLYRYDDLPLLMNSPDDLLIYHYCIGDDAAILLMRRIVCTIVVKYHNVTPARFTMSYAKDYSRVSRVGREMLLEVAELPISAVIGDSDYNAAEFATIAPKGVRLLTVPPFHQVDQLLGMPVDPGTLAQVTSRWFNILAVGRVVPNKGFELMLSSLASALQTHHLNVHLHLVGTRDPRLEDYLERLQEIIDDNDLGGAITWHGSVNAARLATLYRYCDLFWTASQHEGFCIPVVEAMAFGLPVLSTRRGALAETCGDAAAFADDREECVRMLARLVTDDEFRRGLGNKGLHRYAVEFRTSRTERRFQAAIKQVQDDCQKRISAASLAVEGDWFGLPDAERLIAAALSVSDPVHPGVLAGRDRRLDFVDWLLREGWKKSPDVALRLRSSEFWQYAEDIEVPAIAAQLDPLMRLRWQFNRTANSCFDLRSPQSVAAFIRWCQREREGAYEFDAALAAS